ncbi:MAG: Gfo/Idh/MocA family oxidoreductase, partial [Spirochaetes bacterium]|nr:Gfo/Idh/MocA family oxidoreductase [Spirochaetota bacterium]
PKRRLSQRLPRRIKKYTDYRLLVDDPDIDLILVTTPTYFHREPCEYALRSGKKVYLDKPIAVTTEDSEALVNTVRGTGNALMMGFTRRYERSWGRASDLVREGRIGRMAMMQIRSVIPYTRYYHTWHRRNAWSGGALNDKSSHHFDVFNWFAGSRCVSLSGIGGASPQFAPEETPPAGCFSCTRDCPYDLRKDPDFQEMSIRFIPPSWKNARSEEDRIDTCVFKPGADITDHAFVNLAYENGVKASLMLCIYGPKTPDQETLELVGTEGRLTLTRGTGIIDLYADHGRTHEIIDTRDHEFSSSHFGADMTLVRELKRFVDGERPVAGVEDGHESLRMVKAAQASINAGGELHTL